MEAKKTFIEPGFTEIRINGNAATSAVININENSKNIMENGETNENCVFGILPSLNENYDEDCATDLYSLCPFKVSNYGLNAQIRISGKTFSSKELFEDIFKAHLNKDENTRVVVPSFFKCDDLTVDGQPINFSSILDEHMKAMKGSNGICIAFRLGDWYFDSMIVDRKEDGSYEVIDTYGTTELSVEIMAQKVADKLWFTYKRKMYNEKVDNQIDTRDSSINIELRKAALIATKELQNNENTTANYKIGNTEMSVLLTRAEFDYVCEEQFIEIMTVLVYMLRKHGMDRKDVKNMICCGGEKPKILIKIAEDEFQSSSLIMRKDEDC